MSVFDNFVSQPHGMQLLLEFQRRHVPADERDSFLLCKATDRLPSAFDPEDPGACAAVSNRPLPIAGS